MMGSRSLSQREPLCSGSGSGRIINLEDNSSSSYAGIGIKGALYQERVKSFNINNWPWIDPTRQTCTPDELAMAGFMWHQERGKYPKIVCFCCNIEEEFSNLSPDDNPWDLHESRSPNCPYVQLNRRKLPRDYKFKEIFDIVANKFYITETLKLVGVEKQLKSQIGNLKTLEEEHQK